MLKYGEYITETLVDEVKAEPRTAAARQARKMGLTYIGFGRYTDKKGRIAYIVDHDRLVPYKNSEEINDLYYKADDTENEEKRNQLYKVADTTSDERKKRFQKDREVIKAKKTEIKQTAQSLKSLYNPNLFTYDELDAIDEYTNNGYEDINRYLYKGHDEGADYKKDQYVQSYIRQLDSAFEATTAPFNYNIYSGLSSRYKASKIKAGEEYIFRGYVSGSIDYDVAIDSFSAAGNGDNKEGVVLQIEVGKGQRSIYVDGVSQNSGELETMLPRGSRLRIISGPHTISNGVLKQVEDDYPDEDTPIKVFKCKIIEDK
jgi:hypothetical protein